MKIILFQPQIPQNTGNIGRLCVATQTPLVMVRPLGFFIHSKELKRAGLDYWEYLDWRVVGSLEEMLEEHKAARSGGNAWYFSKKAARPYTDAAYKPDDLLIFGSETDGLPPEVLEKNFPHTLQIPMWGPTRSLNLATAAGIALYEAYRQTKKF